MQFFHALFFFLLPMAVFIKIVEKYKYNVFFIHLFVFLANFISNHKQLLRDRGRDYALLSGVVPK